LSLSEITLSVSLFAHMYFFAACLVHFIPILCHTRVDAQTAHYFPSHFQENRDYVFLIRGYISSIKPSASGNCFFPLWEKAA
jgi:hypothetical protein